MTVAEPKTLPQYLLWQAQHEPDRVALRERHRGIWQAITFAEYLDHVKRFCAGLIGLGLESDETIAIIGDNRPEWIIAELAAQSAGARSIGIYQDASVSEMAYLFRHADAKFIVVEDQEQVDKIVEIWPELSQTGKVRKVIYYDPGGLGGYDSDFLLPFADVQALGDAWLADNPGRLDDQIAAGKGDDLAILSTTSGTTAEPKLAMLSHDNLLTMAQSLLDVDPLGAGDELVSFLPLAWVGEQMVSLACALQAGCVVNFPEKPETVQHDLREIGPRVLFSPPRIYENMVTNVQVKIADATWLARTIYRWAMAIGHRVADIRLKKARVPAGLQLLCAACDLMVFAPLRSHLGLRHVVRAYTGGAALGPDVFRFFHAIGVNLKQIYGQTETSGISVLHRDGDIRFQTVGEPLPGTEVRIDDSGEILVRSSAVMRGYYRNDEATRAALRDGWLYSGDAGYIDEAGHLVVIDRVADVMTLADGTAFSPQFIENKLKFSPYVKEAVVFGGDYPFVTAVINIEFENVGKWAENNKIAYTTYTDLAQKDEVYALVGGHVDQANDDLPEAARIQRFVLLHKELDADDAELTRTRKVRRRLIAQRYAGIVEALYSDRSTLEVETEITYRDGRTANIATSLRLATPEAAAKSRDEN